MKSKIKKMFEMIKDTSDETIGFIRQMPGTSDIGKAGFIVIKTMTMVFVSTITLVTFPLVLSSLE